MKAGRRNSRRELTNGPTASEKMEEKTGRRTTPIILIKKVARPETVMKK
ncbi:MAG: hypothetical protein UX91_C0007G0176 [Candidatus Amesbacteria bacterium GW2011_GWB1_47_19]|nr:MAG: hypothetical protein UW51_C0006G0014 [Candidatus Amesbacteria bacterium GW2011_GWA1_44_24]KKU31953.1 MAG: hypothetical protein UX46_C0002G0176 [Candidatus Amesbacteria bacterium GW2011_GWC1_46_24]KKU66889.1 MAG: hypothetical protein UX91_C0007G0176 [Candidatus Amesbacteria bacterium GW2011_GWB1_47_19]